MPVKYDACEEEIAQSLALRLLAGPFGERARIRERARAVDDEQRPAVDADVARIAKQRSEVRDQTPVGLGRVLLRHQDRVVAAVPAPRPVLVRPADAKREIGFAAAVHLVERTLEQAASVEPVVVVTEAMDTVAARERGLLDARFGNAQVVEAEIRWKMGLVVPGEQRSCAHDVAPLGEALAPPRVVLGNRVKLRQVERDQLAVEVRHVLSDAAAPR